MRNSKEPKPTEKNKAGTEKKKHSGFGAVAAVVIAVGAVGYVAYRAVRKLFVPAQEKTVDAVPDENPIPEDAEGNSEELVSEELVSDETVSDETVPEENDPASEN